MATKYQTLSQFMRSPFKRTDSMDKNIKYNELYENFIRENRIRVAGYTIVENSYYIHLKIPSENKKNAKYEYDVVIRFFTNDPILLRQSNLRAYYIQFFSNSPGFIYRYAVLYKQEGFLINALQDKLDPEYKDKLPEKTNSEMKLSYDKSIYFACRYLSDKKFRLLNKVGYIMQHKKLPDKFFSDISDFKSVKYDQDILSTERQLKKELDKKKAAKSKSTTQGNKKVAKLSSSTGGLLKSITYAIKKNGNSHKIKKKTASKSTRRK